MTHLCLFLSRATLLAHWQKMGILERETAVYRHLRQRIGPVTIITSGGQDELAYSSQPGEFPILYNRWGIPTNLYSLLAPWMHYHTLRRADIYKTNQLDGAWTAVIAAKLFNKPVIVRAGYLWANQNFDSAIKARLIRLLERWSLRQATAVVLTTPQMAEFVSQIYHIPVEKITVIPNYVDTDVFHPQLENKKVRGQICFVGRLDAVKNLDLLIRGLAGLDDVRLTLIGDGPEKNELQQLAQSLGVTAEFPGIVTHDKLPALLNQAELFVLPSQFEGHPKALIEAMACGLPVLGSDVPGIRDLIRHGETGWLCPPDVESLGTAVSYLMADPVLRRRLGDQARAYAVSAFSLPDVVQLETAVINRLVAAKQRN